MRRPIVMRCFLILTALGASGCMQTPGDYSPNYSYVSVVSEKNPGRVKKALVPNSCFGASEAEDVDRDGKSRLPPGCANAFNLQRMAERESDLVHGRPLGKASGAVSARAAQKYLNKEGSPLAGADEQGGGGQAGGNETLEQASSPVRKAQ